MLLISKVGAEGMKMEMRYVNCGAALWRVDMVKHYNSFCAKRERERRVACATDLTETVGG
jgi:hypothetical protein